MLIRTTNWSGPIVILLDDTIYNRNHQARANGLHYVDAENTDTLITIANDEAGMLSDAAEPMATWVFDTNSILDKWMALNISLQEGLEYYDKGNILLADNIAVRDAILTEIQPYWEQNLIYSYIANTYLTPDDVLKAIYGWGQQRIWNNYTKEWVVFEDEFIVSLEGVAIDYFEKGAVDVQDELSPFFNQPDVQAVFAESALFLSLTQDQRYQYSAMSRDDQYEMLFVEPVNYDQYIRDHKVLDLLWMSMDQLTLDHYHVIDLTALGDRLAQAGIDGYAWFRAEFEEETQVIRYDAVTDAIDPIIRLYYGVLGRAPEKGGLEWWINTFNTDDTKIIEQMAADFAWSEEFLGVDPAVGPTAEQLITALYQNVLGRDPDTEGYEWWLDKAELAFEYDLRGGNVPGTNSHTWLSPQGEEVFTFGRIVTGFTESAEFIEQSISDVYASGIALWGPNYEDLISHGEELGFVPSELIGINTTHDDYFL